MAVDTETRPYDQTEAGPAGARPPGRRRPGRHPVITIGATVLALALVLAALVATWPEASRPHPASAPGRPAAAAHVGRPAPAAAALAQPGTRSSGPASSAGSAVSGTVRTTTGQAPTAAPTTPWSKRDSAVLSAQTAAYFIAGTIYGDPPGNRPGVVTIANTAATHLRRGGTSGATLDQLRQAVLALGGQASVARSKSGGGRAAFTLPAGRSIVLDSHGWVRINGVDAFGLRRTATGWTSTATGPQVRAFLAGFIEGEGSVGGKIGDDPTAAHLAFVQALMTTSQAYGVRTVLTGTRYFALSVASTADFAKVQAYPFITFSRCPGGRP